MAKSAESLSKLIPGRLVGDEIEAMRAALLTLMEEAKSRDLPIEVDTDAERPSAETLQLLIAVSRSADATETRWSWGATASRALTNAP